MSPSHVRPGALAAPLLGLGIALAVASPAIADPVPPPAPAPAVPPSAPVVQADAPAPDLPGLPPPPGLPDLSPPPALPGLPPPPGVPGADAQPVDAAIAAKTACSQFGGALDYGANYYGDFADSIAGNGAFVDYNDPNVQSNNLTGRTALRQAAAAAMDAAATPGLAPEVANPMRTWSLNAAKLVLMMGVRANGDAIDSAATDVNVSTKDVQMACAQAGAHA